MKLWKKWLVAVAVVVWVCCVGVAVSAESIETGSTEETSDTAQTEAVAVNVVKSAVDVDGGTWVKKTAGMKYLQEDGTYLADAWVRIDGTLYYFSAKGYRKTGWFTYAGNRYCADANGAVLVSYWVKKGSALYFLGSDGVRVQGCWKKISKKYYYFGSTGKLAVSKWVKTNGKYYYVDSTGVRQTSSWITSGKKTYYVNGSGVRVVSKWKKIDGKYYYFNAKGVLQKSQWIGVYYVGEDGARLVSCTAMGYKFSKTGKSTWIGKYIFVGDSRTVGMSYAVSDSQTVFIGKVGAGLSYLKSTATTSLKSYLNADPYAKVYFAFGVNDLGNIASYISYYQQLMAAYPNTEFYFLSVNPVNETLEKKYGYSITNTQISAFNTKLAAAFPDNYLDTYTYLTTNGFSTTDGLHYAASTYVKLYKYVLGVG